MSQPLSRPPADLGAYVDLRIFDVPSQDLINAMIAMYGISNPGWVAREGNTEVLLMEAIALAVAENVVAINRLPGAVVEAVLGLAGVLRDFGAPATCTATINVADNLGYTIPTGTRFYLTLATGQVVVFLAQSPDTQIASGQTSATVNLISQINTAAANGVAAGARLVLADQLNMIQSITLSSTVAGGRDPETDVAWRDRGVARLQRLSDALVVPQQFNAFIDEDVRIGRVMTIDLWDGSVGSPTLPGTNPGHITSAVLDPTGLPLGTSDLTDLQNQAQAKAAAMLAVHVVNATLDNLNVFVTFTTAAGYTASAVAASVTAAIRNYVNPLTWTAGAPARHNEFVSLVDQVPGVDYVNHLLLNGSTLDIVASSPRALPQANVVDSADPVAGGGFEDHFNSDTSTLSTTLWTAAGTAAIVSNRLRMTAHSTYADSVTSVAKYNFTGRRVQVKTPTVPTATAGEMLVRVYTDANNWLSIGKSGANLLMRIRLAGVNNDTTLAYDATNHVWLRIRESAPGTVVWETSADGASWTVRRTASAGLPAYTSTNMVLIAGHTSAGSTDDQIVEFDDFTLI
jgi:uncharacterized phage protein gp47/JayE